MCFAFIKLYRWIDTNSIHRVTAAEGQLKYCSWYGCTGAAGEQCEDSRQHCRNHWKSSTWQAFIAGQSRHAGKGYRKGKGQSPSSPQQAVCQAPLYAWTSQCWLLWSTCWISQVRNTNSVEPLGVMLFFGQSLLRNVILIWKCSKSALLPVCGGHWISWTWQGDWGMQVWVVSSYERDVEGVCKEPGDWLQVLTSLRSQIRSHDFMVSIQLEGSFILL